MNGSCVLPYLKHPSDTSSQKNSHIIKFICHSNCSRFRFKSHICLGNLDFIGPVYLIQFTFRRLEIPPNYSTNHLGKCKSIVWWGLPQYIYLPFLSACSLFSVFQQISFYISFYVATPFSQRIPTYIPKHIKKEWRTVIPNRMLVQVLFFFEFF